MESNFSTAESTSRFKDRFPETASGNFRIASSLTLSSIGIGTYLGNWDEETDDNYVESILEYIRLGGNVIDTAANYRFQRSERSIGRAIGNLSKTGAARDELFICTKAGFLPFDNEPPRDVSSYFEREFIAKGVATFDDLVGGSHCMAPDYLKNQIDQSLQNLGIAGIDLFYIHNPESQLAEIDKYRFEARIAAAFEALEEYRAARKINHYGIASWNGFRVVPDDASYHSLERFVSIARQVAGDDHGLKFIQLPHNLAMPEAYLLPNQAVEGKVRTAISASKHFDLSVMVSAPLLQGKLALNVPFHIRETLGGLTTDAMTSLQFVRSTPGVTSALTGMSSVEHVRENMRLTIVSPAEERAFEELFSGTD